MRHAVILAGGSGERFWPLSRPERPKQFLPLGGDVSLIRATYNRLRTVVAPERIWVVTLDRHARAVRRELPEIAPSRILREPEARNTAPALYYSALALQDHDPKATMLVVPADAWAPQVTPYRKALRTAMTVAEKEPRLVLIGVQPTRVETGYGYILPGKALSSRPGREVNRFEEKPSMARARRFYSGKKHLWNCGIFAWKTEMFLDAVEAHLPALAKAFSGAGMKKGTALKKAYSRAPRISVDYGVLEPAGNVAVVPASFPWDDLGSWRALERLGNGEFKRGAVASWDSPGLVAWAESGNVAVIGVPEVVVVHTPEATLVMAKDRAQDVRQVVKAFSRKRKKKQAAKGSRRVTKS